MSKPQQKGTEKGNEMKDDQKKGRKGETGEKKNRNLGTRTGKPQGLSKNHMSAAKMLNNFLPIKKEKGDLKREDSAGRQAKSNNEGGGPGYSYKGAGGRHRDDSSPEGPIILLFTDNAQPQTHKKKRAEGGKKDQGKKRNR